MKRSEHRILTTHAGSLPRPAELTSLFARRSVGEAVDERAIETLGRAAVCDIVRRQIEAGLDVNRFGKRLFNIFFKTYTEKVWGMSCDEISADWAAQRIKGLDLRIALMNALGRSFRGGDAAGGAPAAKTLIEKFEYPRKGPGMMWEAAARGIVERGRAALGRARLPQPLVRG